MAGSQMNANANFWATDGIAALGIPGIVVATLLVVFLLKIIDGLLGQRNLPVYCGALVPFIVGITNSSLFTSALTGGGVALIALLLLWSRTLPVADGGVDR